MILFYQLVVVWSLFNWSRQFPAFRLVLLNAILIPDYFFWFLHVEYFDLAASFEYSQWRKFSSQETSTLRMGLANRFCRHKMMFFNELY